jgi:hypothetical protein
LSNFKLLKKLLDLSDLHDTKAAGCTKAEAEATERRETAAVIFMVKVVG